MPYSSMGLNDRRQVIDNATGRPIPDVIEAQTSAITGPSYLQAVRRSDGSIARHLFGGVKTRLVRADISVRA